MRTPAVLWSNDIRWYAADGIDQQHLVFVNAIKAHLHQSNTYNGCLTLEEKVLETLIEEEGKAQTELEELKACLKLSNMNFNNTLEILRGIKAGAIDVQSKTVAELLGE